MIAEQGEGEGAETGIEEEVVCSEVILVKGADDHHRLIVACQAEKKLCLVSTDTCI